MVRGGVRGESGRAGRRSRAVRLAVRLVVGVVAAASAVIGVIVPGAPAASAGGWSSCRVTNTTKGRVYPADGGSTLQQAIDGAAPRDTLEVRGRCVGEYVIRRSLRLVGVASAGHPLPTLLGRTTRPVVFVRGGSVSLAGLTITHGGPAGSSSAGRGILNAAALTLARSSVSGNGADRGGGIYNKGVMTILRSTIDANTAGDGGGIYNTGTLAVRSSTIAANLATLNQGGGIFSDGPLVLSRSTVSGNSAQWLGGGVAVTGQTVFEADILSGNSAGASGPDCTGQLVSNGYNLIWTTDGGYCDFVRAVGDQVGPSAAVEAGLAALADNGGPTRTMALGSSSTALDAIPIGALGADGSTRLCPASGSSDQRFSARPRGVGCDLGAYELHG